MTTPPAASSEAMVRLIVTPARRRVLQALAEYGVLTTEQFYGELRPAGRTRTQERAVRRLLTLMKRAGYVTRIRLVLDRPHDPFLRYTYAYRLAKEGLAALGKANRADASASLAHDVEITHFHRALRSAAAAANVKLWWLQENLRRTVHPDAVFALTDSRKPRDRSTFYYFLEIEKSRQGHYRDGRSGLVEKLARYLEYRATPRVRQDWRYFSDYRVIVVVATEERRSNLLRKLAQTLPSEVIWVATANDCRASLANPIFRSPLADATCSLFAGTNE